ncbi:MAG: ROK family protein [Spirosomataceae bacterium]
MLETTESVVSIKKKYLKQQAVRTVYAQGAITISSLARILRISIPSATTIVQELINEHWFQEVGAQNSKFGRKPILFDLNGGKQFILVIDIGIHQTSIQQVDLRNGIEKIVQFPLAINDPDFVVKLSVELGKAVKTTPEIWGICMTSPGLIDVETQENQTYSNHQISGISLPKKLQEVTGVPTFIINDTKASLLGENHFGLARDKRNVMLLNLDWGIGLGILSNGEIMQGADGFAGEIGHIQVVPGGQLCHCGKIGCLETVASVASLLRRAQDGLKKDAPTTLQKNQTLTIETIIEAANQGDEFSIELIYELGRELGKGLSMAIHLLNPELIIIDGLLTNTGANLTTAIEQSINKFCLRDFKNTLHVLISPMGETAKILGAKQYVFDQLIRTEFQETNS